MAQNEGLLIALRLFLTVAFISLSFYCMRIFNRTAVTQVSKANVLVASTTSDLAKSLSGKVVNGVSAIQLADSYYMQVPVLLITGELYNGEGAKYTYDLSQIHSQTSMTYINPQMEYKIDVSVNSDEVSWIRIVQADLTGKLDLATVLATKNDFTVIQSKYELQQELIQDQFRLYQKQ